MPPKCFVFTPTLCKGGAGGGGGIVCLWTYESGEWTKCNRQLYDRHCEETRAAVVGSLPERHAYSMVLLIVHLRARSVTGGRSRHALR